VSLDAVSALSDLLPADVPKPESPKLRPEDMVSEDKHKEKDAVLVGERDDTIHPDYRFKKEDLEKLPAPKPEPTMGTGEALDILSGDFAASLAVPAVCTPAPPVQVQGHTASVTMFRLSLCETRLGPLTLCRHNCYRKFRLLR
uniref:Calpastatin n=1 Tax=Salarias fasciatus TaxID=181472 RepID=A0A672HBN2_SALFA